MNFFHKNKYRGVNKLSTKNYTIANRTRDKQYQGKFDVWLNRASTISQIGILVVTTLMFYFTVIPLYQKEVLEESIAKKEIELSALTNKIIKNKLQSVLKNFVHYSAECGGLLISPNNGEQEFDNRESEFWKIDVTECLNKGFAEIDKAGIPKDIISKLQQEIDSFSKLQAKKKADLRTRFDAMEEKLLSNPSLIEPISGFLKKGVELLKIEAKVRGEKFNDNDPEIIKMRIDVQLHGSLGNFALEMASDMEYLLSDKFIDGLFEK